VIKVGVNQRWRDGVRVLFRRTLEQGKEAANELKIHV
jgi:hypothetical protein